MKKIIFLLATTALLTSVSCKKSGSTNDDVNVYSPRTEVPSEMLTPNGKYWTIGTVSSVNFYNTNSNYYNYVKNGGGVVVFFKFKSGGYFENLIYVVANSYGTETETWTSLEGTVEFTMLKGYPVFKTHATKGTYRIKKNAVESSRPIPTNDLVDQHSNTFLWEPETDPNNPSLRFFATVNLDFYPQVDLDDISGTLRPEWINHFHVEN
jgi:hypothetical protein